MSPAGRWEVTHERAAAADLHARDLVPGPGERRAVFVTVEQPALVLGSTQSLDVVDTDVARRARVDVVRRRSGGGGVLLVPDEHVWVDVLLSRDDPCWSDDVSTSSRWLGDAWAAAIDEVTGATGEVHVGPMRRDDLSDLVCFAGLAPGEVTIGGAKAVGISQRRTRDGARFQCVAYRRFEVDLLADLLRLDRARVAAVPVAMIDAPAEALAEAIVGHLPT